MKFAVIGTSWITDSYIDGALASGVWELSAVYSRSYDTGKQFAEKYGVDLVYTDLREFAKSDEFSAVYVASPNVFHAEQCKELLNGGKHVICEKPIVSYTSQLNELYEIADKNGLIFIEAIKFMHNPTKNLIEENLKKLGNISMANFSFCQRSSKLDNYLKGEIPNIFNPDMHTGGLMDLGVYCIYPALYYFGEPKSYSVSASIMDTGADSLGTITLKYDEFIVNLKYSKVSQSDTPSDIQGTDGTIYIGAISRLVNVEYISKTGEKNVIFAENGSTDLMKNEALSLYNFITDIDNHKEHYSRCKEMSKLVLKYMEIFRKEIGLTF